MKAVAQPSPQIDFKAGKTADLAMQISLQINQVLCDALKHSGCAQHDENVHTNIYKQQLTGAPSAKKEESEGRMI